MAASGSNGVQIIDITNPSNPVAASAPTNGGAYSKLTDASSIAVVTGQSTYAFVTSPHNEQNAIQTVKSGIQIIDITTPYSPTPVSPILDGTGGYTTLKVQHLSPPPPSTHQRMPWWQLRIITAFKL